MPRHTTLLVSLLLSTAAACSTDKSSSPLAPPSQSTLSEQNGVDDQALGDDVAQDDNYTLAVIGDTPYGPIKLAEFPSLIAKINADPQVRLVAHLGDIKAGKNSLCTNEYFSMIRGFFDTFEDPFVYTPGDNEWTDCHSSKGNGSYTPTERLQKVREDFFPQPGHTLGINSVGVATEARDPQNSAYVENTMFKRAGVVFAAVNIPGSNNDLAAWGAVPSDASNYPSQADEFAARAVANRAWIAKAFATAEKTHAKGVVLLFQADMWDPAEPTLTGFNDLVQQIGALAQEFGKPVLLLEGDSHKFNVDNPYSASSSLHGLHPSTPLVGNITRIVVEGSDAGRTEYLRLKVDPSKKASSLFSWERVPLN
jgi:hypothetical protein